MKIYLLKKSGTKATKIQYLCDPECKGSRTQAIDETTGILLVMTVRRHGFHKIYISYTWHTVHKLKIVLVPRIGIL